tara:strand:- start:963 stop:1271 length:309 start_codon:yes stop_codon:yes gene_type:complete
MIRRKLALNPIYTLLIRTSHDRRITDQNVDSLNQIIDLLGCISNGRLRSEIAGDECCFHGWVRADNGVYHRLDLLKGAPSEDEVGWEAGGKGEDSLGADAAD